MLLLTRLLFLNSSAHVDPAAGRIVECLAFQVQVWRVFGGGGGSSGSTANERLERAIERCVPEAQPPVHEYLKMVVGVFPRDTRRKGRDTSLFRQRMELAPHSEFRFVMGYFSLVTENPNSRWFVRQPRATRRLCQLRRHVAWLWRTDSIGHWGSEPIISVYEKMYRNSTYHEKSMMAAVRRIISGVGMC